MNLSGNHAVDTGAAVTSLGCFVLGASICGALVRQPEPGRRWPSRAPQVVTAEALLVLLSATVGWQIDPHPAWLVAPLAVAMGMQSTVARRLGLTYLTGGYITGGLTAGALGSPLGDRSSRSWWYAGLPVGAMALGAVGAAFVATRRLTLAVILVAALAGVASALIWHAPAVGPDPDD
jgi:uncharacterized membrane protein YoaK (UPF0700 family)